MHLIFKADTSAASSHTVQQHVSTTQRQPLYLKPTYTFSLLPSPEKEGSRKSGTHTQFSTNLTKAFKTATSTSIPQRPHSWTIQHPAKFRNINKYCSSSSTFVWKEVKNISCCSVSYIEVVVLLHFANFACCTMQKKLNFKKLITAW